MNMIHAMMAQSLIPNDVLPASHWMGLSVKELVILLGAVTAVTLLLVIWAVYFRKKPHRHHHHHHDHDSSSEEVEPAKYSDSGSAEGESGRRYRRKRRRRRDHRPRNPTLAETGGLPPLRTDRPADPLP